MADDSDTLPETHGIEPTNQKRLSGKKLLFVIVPLIVILGAGAGLYFTGKLDSLIGKKEKTTEASASDAATAGEDDLSKAGFYFDMPDLIINLNDQNNRQRFLKLSISIEIASPELQPSLEAVMPRITDQFQTYLRELRVEDLRGSAGIYRLRQELLARVRGAAGTVKVRDVLFREILVQ